MQMSSPRECTNKIENRPGAGSEGTYPNTMVVLADTWWCWKKVVGAILKHLDILEINQICGSEIPFKSIKIHQDTSRYSSVVCWSPWFSHIFLPAQCCSVQHRCAESADGPVPAGWEKPPGLHQCFGGRGGCLGASTQRKTQGMGKCAKNHGGFVGVTHFWHPKSDRKKGQVIWNDWENLGKLIYLWFWTTFSWDLVCTGLNLDGCVLDSAWK